MVRILALAALVTLFGAGASQAQYQDSAPPDEQNRAPQYDSNGANDNGYDEELLGPRDDHRYNDDRDYDSERGYSRPNVDVGIFANLTDGRWFFTGNFGWVWRPYAAVGWRPYSDGRWVWTSYGWTWVSYEPFGWATYHYGYWDCDARLGWVWIPGYDWSACRVQWAYYDDYVCWAPLPPPGYSCPRPYTTAGFNIWFTVGASHFCDPYPTRYCVRPAYKSVYVQTVAYKSPDRHFVERYSGAPIRTSTVDFKHRTVVRGTNGFGGVRSETITKSRPYSQPYRGSQQFKTAKRPTYLDTRALETRPRESSWTRQVQPREAKRSYSREAPRPMFETHRNDMVRVERQRPAQQQMYGGGSRQPQRYAQSSRQTQRSAEQRVGKQKGRDAAKSKGGDNGRNHDGR